MRKIIPLIVLVLLSAFFTKAQNVSQDESNLALQLVSSQDAIISQEMLSNVKVLYTYEDAATGIRYISLQQTYKGIPVYNQIQALSFRNGKLASNFGVLDPNMEKAINVASGIPAVTAESAVQSALSDRGFRASQMAIAINRKDEGKFVEFGNMGVSRENITAQLTWVPNELTKQYHLAWQVYIIPKTTSDYWMVRVNAVDNSILGVDNYTDYDNWGNPFENPSIKYPGFDYGNLPAPNTSSLPDLFDFKKSDDLKSLDDPNLVSTASYRVVPLPAESPLHPGGAPALRTDPWNNAGVVPNAVTLRWHTGAAAADYSHSRSNNVWAYHDRTNQNAGDITRSANSTTAFPNLTFDFVPDFTQEPVVTTPPNQQFNITNLFYWNNLVHDILYGYGFTEPGRNFQDDNLGRGGAGNDHVNAEAQDGSGVNNANFSTPADGGSGRMQMYLWNAPTPDRDGDVDNGIILHEFGHGVSNRSNPGGTGCLGNAEAAGEGWSDYIGLMLTQNWATSTVNNGFNSPRGIGTYALNQPNNGPGIRPQRYCTDFAVNNATYATLPGQAIPHGVGWVFCSALWELTWELINDPSTTGIDPNIYNFAGTGGNIVAMRLMMEGLRTQPCQPGFITSRDAILAADVTLYGGSHTCAIWRAFARRGMGFGAAQGSSASINDQTVSFAMPPTCVVAGPTVTINQAAAQPDPTTVSPINFTVVFSEVVTGFATGDVSLGGTAGATLGTVTGSGTTYNVAVSGMTATGTVIATIPAGVATNAANEPNNPSTSTDNTVTYITTPPGVCTTWVGSVGPANTPVALRANRDGIIKTCAAATCPAAAGIAGALHYVQRTWTNPTNAVQCVTVTYSNPTTNFSFVTAHNGSVVLTNFCTNWLGDPGSSAPAGGVPIVWSFNAPPLATIVFHIGNVTAGQTADYSLQISAPNCAPLAPAVTINQAAAQPDPTSVSPINFTVVFDQVVTGFATGDVVLSGTAGATTGTVTGSGTTYNVAVSGMTQSGTVIATVPAGVAINGAGDPNTASTSTDNTVTFNFIAPPCVTYTGQITAADPTIGFRAFRDGVASTCAVPGPCGAPVAGSFQYKIFTWTNPTAAVQCVTVNYSTPTPNFSFVTAYNGSVDLANLCTNYLGDPGNSAVPGTPIVWSFNAPANATISFLVTNVVGGQTADFSIAVNAPTCNACPTQTVDPVANQTVCAGAATTAVNFTSTPPGATFNWTNSNPTIGLAASGTGNIPSFTAINATTSPVTATVTVTPQSFSPVTVTGSLATGDGILTDRIFRDGVASTCAAPKAFPGMFGVPGSYFYDLYTYVNSTGSAQCVTVTYSSTTAAQVHVTAYNGSFNPANQAANYIADGGLSAISGSPITFSFTAPAGATIVFVATEPIDSETNPSYSINISGLQLCTGTPRTFTYTVNPNPSVNPIPNQVLCQNQPTAPVNFTGTPAGVVFQWTNNNTLIGLAASGTGNIPSFIAQNPTGVQQVATITVTPVTGLSTPVVTTFNFTGAVQTFTVPAGITSVNIKSWGAQGNRNAGGIAGGLGGYAEGNLAVTAGQVLNVMVGGGNTTSATGGFNGGGAAGSNPGCAAAVGGGGGGASDVRISPYALANRVIVGAGGGGAGGNRTAGCGRGAGGGGGGGLWGGGGGAGWPGVPPGGPVPTGGTQSAGGAGGVTTWTAGGPTNGLPGVLAVGGAGGNEIASAQGTPTGPAEPGGVGGGLIGANGNYNPANNWNGQSGAGGSSYIGGVTSGVTTPGLRAGAGQVQITYTPPSATTCFGTPRTFTITVNPNANLIIVADPGTTICEGDPTLLTVYNAGAASAPGTLYTQGTAAINGSPSQVFEPANAAFDSQAADDFTVPAATNWSITNITTMGINSGGGAPTSVNVFFYSNSSNLPGAAIASYTNVLTFVRTGANYNVTLPTPLTLGAGTYWVSMQVNMSFATSGQWFWGNFGAANIGNEYAWRNPGGGFATPCTNWGYGGTGCNVGGGPANRNKVFSLIGSSVTVGTIATGTFLWSPALGLSSTTSNPVAASPMNTTTYTVTRTTVPGGCVASAQITINVNKRPVVTSHPVNRTNCVGNTATFTVGGTGTGLTYQWQVSPTGCAGPWTNLTNTAPYSGVNTAILQVSPVSMLQNGYAYRAVLSGTCTPFIPPTNVSNCAILTVNPNPNIAITPAGPVCGGVAGINGTALTVTAGSPPIPGNVSANSGVINVPIPDGTGVAATTNLTISGVPANATITEIKVNMNINHTWVGDVDVNLRAPNNAILNLVGSLDGGTGSNQTDNFTNTTFSSLGGATISGAPAPRTNTFAAEARVGYGPIGFIQTVTTWAGLVPPATPTAANGQWTLAAGDFVGTDIGTITNWSINIDYTTPGTGTQVVSFAWSPLAGLYTNTIATTAYTGTNLATVYAAPTVQTTYTVRATDVATGCFTDASVLVNYTPPAPTVTPNPVVMCLGDPAVMLRSSSSTSSTGNFTSGAVNIPIPDGPTIPPVPTSYPATSSNITVSGIPAGATVTAVRARFNVTHAWVSDLVMALRAPNGQIVNLSALLNRTNQPGANFTNTVISSASTTPLGGAAPYTGTYADDAAGATFTALGFTWPGGPVGYVPNTTQYTDLFTIGGGVNGVWSIGIYDAGAPDGGTLNNWSLDIDYTLGVPATPAVWSPAGGLYSNAAATTPYVAGTAVDSVWARPGFPGTPGVYTYQATVRNIIGAPSTILTPMAGGNGNNLVAFNVRNNNTYPVTFNSISSNAFGSGAVVSRVFYKAAPIAGAPGPISAANGWTQFGTANNTVVANTLNLLMTGLTLVIPPGATYGIALDMTGATFPAYTNGGAIVTYSNAGVDLITGGNVGWGGPAAPGTPVNNPRNFNGSITLLGVGAGTCTSPARTVTVTVNAPTTVVTQPVAQTVCTDKVATFTVTPGGSGPFSYQWQVSTFPNGNNPIFFTNITNGGVYSGATTATLTITAPPVSMNGNFYRVIITGAAPCAAVASFGVELKVNPLPNVVITASPYTSLFPGLVTTLSSSVTPNAPAPSGGYVWLRNGVQVGGNTATHTVNVDGLGDYQLRVTDVNGCVGLSNIITIKDSVSAKCFIYPNPTAGEFQVRYHSVANNNNLPRTLTIYDAKGDRVFTKFYQIGRPYDRMDVDMRAYGKGLYWVEIGDMNGNRLTMCRVVIQ